MKTGATDRSESRRRLLRQGLRALNGAALGAPIGGMLGFLLGGVSALIVSCLQGTFSFDSNAWPSFGISALYGLIPGVPGGFLIGGTVIIRGGRRRRLTAAGLGLLTGVAYAMLWYQIFQHDLPVLIAMVLSGLAGGVLMAGFLGFLRRRWPWWTRWEATPLPTNASQPSGVLAHP